MFSLSYYHHDGQAEEKRFSDADGWQIKAWFSNCGQRLHSVAHANSNL